MSYILWVVALLEAWDLTNNGRHIGRHLGFYQELEIRLERFSLDCRKTKTKVNTLANQRA